MSKTFCFYFLFLIYPVVSGNDGYHRNINADVLHYEFGLTINDSTNRIEGQTVILIKILDKTDSVSLDLKGLNSEGMGMSVADVSLDGEKVYWKHGEERLIVHLNKSAIRNDTLKFVIKYSGIPADGLIISRNKYGDRTFFADHWPDRAHNYLPCIDHPYDKASVDFIIIAPDKYSVVANGILVEESVLEGNLKLTHWSEIVPLPVKVMAFGVARFAVRYTGDVNNTSVWSWVFPQNRREGFNDYSVAVRPLDFYIRLIGKYPYKKLANVQSKTIYGGLENAGTIFYSENSVTGSGKAERLIAHEIAHQWFGNCVTEADWHHVWLSEGFATYLTSLYFESREGAEILKADMTSARVAIIKDHLKNPKPVIDTTITHLIDLLSVNSYQKGAWVLHMLRHDIGDRDFKEGLRLYYDRYFDSNALSSDFQHVMEEVSGKDLSRFIQQWLYTAGHPELRIWHQTMKKTGITELFIEQEQDHLFEFNLGLKIKDTAGEKNVNVYIKERVTKIVIPSLNDVEIVPDPDVNLLFREVD